MPKNTLKGPSADKAVRAKLVDVAAGRAPADLLIKNARVVDVFGGTVFHASVSVVDGYFAGFHDVEAREVLDAQGKYLMPGLIDAHVHIESSMLVPERFADFVIPHGTTTVIADPHELANVAGKTGLDYMFAAAEKLPLDVRIMLPSCVPATPFEDSGATLKASDLSRYIKQGRVAGIAEMMNFPGVIGKDTDVMAKLELAIANGKMIDGHAPGLSGRELDAYVAAGVRSDHECTSLEELRDRVARGVYVQIRQGSAARNLAALLSGVTLGGLRRCMFCSDDTHPETLVSEGHLNRHLRLAVSLGLDPVMAIMMATINVADCYGLNKGAIAPGREADFLLVKDLKQFVPSVVYIAGKPVAENGAMLKATAVGKPGSLAKSMRVATVPDNAFALKIPSGRARVIGVRPGSLVTRDLERDVRTSAEGVFLPEENPGLNLLAVIERHHATGKIGLGLIEGYGLKGGAIASTISHDSHNIVVAGDSAEDMRKAVQALIKMGGGIVICAGGEITAQLPLPVGGIMTTDTAEAVNAVLSEMTKTAHETMGVPVDIDPFMALSFLALPVIPDLKLTARGLFDVQQFEFVPVGIE